MLKKCHFIGIGGIGMSGLAQILINRNSQVSGSDLASNERIEFLSSSGASISLGKHLESNVPEDASVVYTSMVNENNPELAFAKEKGLALLHRSDLLKLLMKNSKPLLVAGSHGKTTTTSLLAWVLEHAGEDPSYAIGGVLLNSRSNARNGQGSYFVAEADESDGTFLKYDSFGAIVTNIGLDHMDHYKEEKNLLKAFEQFLSQVRNKEHLFYCIENKRLKELRCQGIGYGFCQDAHLRGENFRQDGWNICFDVYFQGKTYKKVHLPLIGYHNALNALAVFGLSLSLNISEEKIRSAFSSFNGVGRRMEIKGSEKGVVMIDDYGHHPTEIKATLGGLREAHPWHRIIAIFQPHRYSRTQHCLGEFKNIFDAVDQLFITDIYAANEKPIDGVDAHSVLNEVKSSGKMPCKYADRKNLSCEVVKNLRPLDLVITIGAGDITAVGGEILKLMRAHPLPPIKLGLVFGGKSQEHEVTFLSARNIEMGINPEIYETCYFAITKEGKWREGKEAERILKEEASVPELAKDAPVLSSEVLVKLQSCDVIFPILHGPYGEDGKIQGLFEMLGKAYVGCGPQSSAICMDKAVLKKLAAFHGLPVVPFVDFSQYDWKKNRQNILKEIAGALKFPLFVKPVHLGSTIGISRVEKETDLSSAIDYALQYDTHVVVEKGIKAREIEFAVYGSGAVCIFPPGEIMTNGKVYDYEGKYGNNGMDASSEAALSEEELKEGTDLAKSAYLLAGCDGFARVDCFLSDQGKFFLNEINPIPGFTSQSLFPRICARWGVDGHLLIDKLVILGLHRQLNL